MNYQNINKKIKKDEIVNPIEVSIDEKNRMYIYDGIHRFCMYLKNKKKCIPVIVTHLNEMSKEIYCNDLLTFDTTKENYKDTNSDLPSSSYNLVIMDKYGRFKGVSCTNETNKFRVIYRAKEWKEFYNKVPDKPYQFINHPDLIKKNSHRNESRLKLIQTKLDVIIPTGSNKIILG